MSIVNPIAWKLPCRRQRRRKAMPRFAVCSRLRGTRPSSTGSKAAQALSGAILRSSRSTMTMAFFRANLRRRRLRIWHPMTRRPVQPQARKAHRASAGLPNSTIQVRRLIRSVLNIFSTTPLAAPSLSWRPNGWLCLIAIPTGRPTHNCCRWIISAIFSWFYRRLPKS